MKRSRIIIASGLFLCMMGMLMAGCDINFSPGRHSSPSPRRSVRRGPSCRTRQRARHRRRHNQRYDSRRRERSICPRCNGTGWIKCPGEFMAPCKNGWVDPCPQCHGTGKWTSWRSGETRNRPCPVCRGKGRYRCKKCGGSGRIRCPRCNGTGRVAR